MEAVAKQFILEKITKPLYLSAIKNHEAKFWK